MLHDVTVTMHPINKAGSVQVYKGNAGRIGIDAIVPLSVAVKMLKPMSARGASSGLYFNQPKAGGLVAIDVQALAPVADRVLAAAKRAGIPIRR